MDLVVLLNVIFSDRNMIYYFNCVKVYARLLSTLKFSKCSIIYRKLKCRELLVYRENFNY